MTLFVDGEFVAHSGAHLPFKIECDALTEADLCALASAARRLLPTFREAHGVPRGGIRFAAALDLYATRNPHDPVLLVDDVLTTGASMEQAREGMSRKTIGVVIFARGPCPSWITPLFTFAAPRNAK